MPATRNGLSEDLISRTVALGGMRAVSGPRAALESSVEQQVPEVPNCCVAAVPSLGDTDAWCHFVCWPVRSLPHEGCWFWFWVLLTGAIGPVLMAVRLILPIIISEAFPGSAANTMLDAGTLLWLFLLGFVVYDVFKMMHPQHGAPAKVRRSVQQAGAAQAYCGVSVLICRVCGCVLRVGLTVGGTVWLIIVALPPTGFWGFPLGALLGGLALVPLGVSWAICLFLSASLIKMSVKHIIDVRIKRLKSLKQEEFDAIDDAEWQREMLDPIRALLQEQLPALSQFATTMGSICVISLSATLLTIPETVAAFRGTSESRDGGWLWLAAQIGAYLVIPIVVLVVPAQVSTATGKTLVKAVHDMRPCGAGVRYDRVSALVDFLRGSNLGQGPGFVVLGTVITMTQLVNVFLSLTGVYPIVLYVVEEFSS
eukprot:COSAG06_NODE_3517_length_5235_cov_4.335475_1_plen_425_part_00